MIKFNIEFDASTIALGGFIEYRYILPNGTFSAWQTNTQIGQVNGYFPFTANPNIVNALPGNFPDFMTNTVYQFRIRQLCIDGSEQLSPVDGNYYQGECPPITLEVSGYIPASNSYGIKVVIPSTVGLSVFSYVFNIYSVANQAVPLTTITVPSNVVEASLPYILIFDDSNVPGGIIQGESYLVQVNLEINTGTQIDIVTCEPKRIAVPECFLWRIETADNWVVKWTDCSGNVFICGGALPYQILFPGSSLFVCSPKVPEGLFCQPGFGPIKSTIDPVTNQLIRGARPLLPPTPCDTALYEYNTQTNPPTLNGYPCQNCI